MPPRVAQTFTAAQLKAIHQAFGARFLFSPRLDIRRRIRLPWGKFYLIVQAGRDKREVAVFLPERLNQHLVP